VTIRGQRRASSCSATYRGEITSNKGESFEIGATQAVFPPKRRGGSAACHGTPQGEMHCDISAP
jgi:hypothetical protein